MTGQIDLASCGRRESNDETPPAIAPIDRSGDPWAGFVEAQTQVLNLINGEGDLGPSLRAIVNSIEDCVGASGCFLAWRDVDGISVASVSSPVLTSELVRALEGLCEADFDGLNDGAADILAQHQSHKVAFQKITNGGTAVSGALLIIGSAEDEVGPKVADQRVAAMASLAGLAIASEYRTHQLISANKRFAALAKNVPGVVYQRVVRPDGDIRYTYISEAATDLFGVSPDEILSDSQALFDCHGPEYYSTFRERLLAASRDMSLWDVEAKIITRDGKRKYTHAIARPHQEPDGSVIWNGVILDQTRIKEAELAAAAAEARTRDAIIETIPQAFVLFDSDDRLMTWNSRFVNLYPELGEVITAGRTYADLIRAEIEFGIEQLPEGVDPQARLYECLARHHLADYVVERQLRNGRWIMRNEHRTLDGGTVVLHTDITDLKDRETALERSNRELETFASIASHDLQEPLRKIDAFGDRLKRKYNDQLGDDGRMYIERMQSAVGRMRSLINDLLDYSRVTTKAKPFKAVALDQVFAEVVGDLQISIENVRGKVEGRDLPVIDADGTQMRQLLQNLIANALKFLNPETPPEVTIIGQVLEEDGRNSEDGKVRIEIRDNGIGFDMKYADRIFGIFQRLHSRSDYEGTGVGLATCRKIVERHGGTIAVSSQPGEGTAFIIELPVRQPNQSAS
ncbi:MAG: ATP-binding protein [Geminicoccaceae bacterium]